MNRDEVVHWLNERLNIAAFKDLSVNGLQVEGRPEVRKIALVTDAALKLYERAAEHKCDMIIAHHGMIWGGLTSITGRVFSQLKALFDAEINLYAAHLPLDAHPELGNNIELARMISLTDIEPFGESHGQMIGVCGKLPAPMRPDDLAAAFSGKIGGAPLVLPFGKSKIETVGIVSGGGGGMLEEASARGLDCLVTGEGRHENHHLALESHLNVIYLGHYHSETAGVKALGRAIETELGLTCLFIDEPTLL